MEEPSPVDALVQLSFLVQATVAEAGATHELSLTQVRMLGVLRDREPQMAQLAAHLGLDRSSTSGLIDRAERRGLVRRTPSTTDRRSSTVALTPAGHDIAHRLELAVAAAIEALVAPLTDTERRQLTRLSAKVDQHASGAVAAAPNPVESGTGRSRSS